MLGVTLGWAQNLHFRHAVISTIEAMADSAPTQDLCPACG
jgi:hypothetical protein